VTHEEHIKYIYNYKAKEFSLKRRAKINLMSRPSVH
jgi:hypothetical protein